MNLLQTVLFFCGILLLVCGTNAQSGCTACTCGTTSASENNDPHYFNVCSNGQEVLAKCPPLTLFVNGTADIADCQPYYGGCSSDVAGCVPCQYFPWPQTNSTPPTPVVPASMTPPACDSIGPAAPYCDPSYYWFCTSAYGTAELRACPPGTGFSTRRIIGCIDWYNWNTIQ
ncbi:unnamed protein product [Hermetia illucens]|uniref:Chitin-binding type-2 domain-containing protein n=1 Tax=Hermetia illucens TaxID=343691 RepID=A0A7R8UHA9_HERIL|nr:unnamed protein product [Hermetia illucens]